MDEISQKYFISLSITSLILAVLASLGSTVLGAPGLLSGIWSSLVWFLLNGFMVLSLFRMVFAEKTKAIHRKRKLLLIGLVKFPVLYLAGFWLLVTPRVSLHGILIGFTAYLFAAISLLIVGKFTFLKADPIS
jgi:hypothetical protein